MGVELISGLQIEISYPHDSASESMKLANQVASYGRLRVGTARMKVVKSIRCLRRVLEGPWQGVTHPHYPRSLPAEGCVERSPILRYLGYLLVFNRWLDAHSAGHSTRQVDRHRRRPRKTQPLQFRRRRLGNDHAVVSSGEFVDAQDHPHRFTSPGGDTVPKPRRGTSLSVRYRPGNPDDAFIATFA